MSALLTAMRLALASVRRNGLRAGLTVLGILIGVASVVMVTALAEGARSAVSGQIASLGSNMVLVTPQAAQRSGVRSPTSGSRLSEDDGRALMRDSAAVRLVAPANRATAQVVAGERNTSCQATGTTTAFFDVRAWGFVDGGPWTREEESTKAKVVVLGSTVARELFPGARPVGRTVRIGRHVWRVVGVLEPKGQAAFGGDQDNMVVVPIGSFRARVARLPPGFAGTLFVSATSEESVDRAVRDVDRILRDRHHFPAGQTPDFTTFSQKQLQGMQSAVYGILSVLLLAIAAVSLVVGGIGVMNIMLVSVTERTREIGVRLAIGARARDVLRQFLLEAVVLALAGGVLGAAVAYLVAFVGKALDVSLVVQPWAVVLAVLSSGLTGVVFGYFPARRAAGLDPIDALRHE